MKSLGFYSVLGTLYCRHSKNVEWTEVRKEGEKEGRKDKMERRS
jgi:hypothetical protein